MNRILNTASDHYTKTEARLLKNNCRGKTSRQSFKNYKESHDCSKLFLNGELLQRNGLFIIIVIIL